ncbi:MAG: DUF1190 domain-containing protein [Phenylobacterium sp.]
MRKRSQTLTLTTMLAGAATLSVGGCDDAQQASQWNDSAARQQVEALQYANVDACKSADQAPDAECESAYKTALNDDQQNAPKYNDRTSCEDVYGEGQCVPRGYGGSSFFTPLLTGFIIGQMLDLNGNRYYRGAGLYRQGGYYGGGGYVTGWGGAVNRDYRTGRVVVARDALEPAPRYRAPPKVSSRTTIVSRGGFGGGGRGFGG